MPSLQTKVYFWGMHTKIIKNTYFLVSIAVVLAFSASHDDLKSPICLSSFSVRFLHSNEFEETVVVVRAAIFGVAFFAILQI